MYQICNGRGIREFPAISCFMVQHEALLALLGHTGGLIRSEKEGFKVAPHVTFLLDYEKTLLERVSSLGHTYLQLASFVKKVQSLYMFKCWSWPWPWP
jgi:hypothetical protein